MDKNIKPTNANKDITKCDSLAEKVEKKLNKRKGNVEKNAQILILRYNRTSRSNLRKTQYRKMYRI